MWSNFQVIHTCILQVAIFQFDHVDIFDGISLIDTTNFIEIINSGQHVQPFKSGNGREGRKVGKYVLFKTECMVLGRDMPF